MNDLRAILLMMNDVAQRNHDYFFNLLEVLVNKHILTIEDLHYIKNHKGSEEVNNGNDD